MLKGVVFRLFRNQLLQITLESIQKNEKLYKYVLSDAYRIIGKKAYERDSLTKLFWGSKTFRWQVNFRIESIENNVARYCREFVTCYNEYHSRIQIPIETTVGYGLYIGHGGPVMVNETAIIGNNCNLSQFTSIGSNEGKAATIGDNVYIGPGVCVVENVTIGSNSTIGAGSVVVKDIPENATAVGNYAKVINYNSPGRYICNRWLEINNE